jgi:hypothetical protein
VTAAVPPPCTCSRGRHWHADVTTPAGRRTRVTTTDLARLRLPAGWSLVDEDVAAAVAALAAAAALFALMWVAA